MPTNTLTKKSTALYSRLPPTHHRYALQIMATYETAENQFLNIQGVKHAYRRFGQAQGVPLFLHTHFRGNMDYWDPAFINRLAEKRPILLVDSTGVGRSEGEVPTEYSGWASIMIDVIRALGIDQIDVFGFSMGGFIVQLMVLQAPDLVRKLVVAGSGPSIGEGVVAAPPEYSRRWPWRPPRRRRARR